LSDIELYLQDRIGLFNDVHFFPGYHFWLQACKTVDDFVDGVNIRRVLDSTGLSAQCVSKLAFCLVQVYHTMRCYERTIWCSGKMQNRKHLLPELFHPFIFPGDTMEDIIVELRGDMSQQRVPLALISSASLRLCASAPLRLKVIRRTEHDRFSSLYLCISTPLGLCVEQRNQVGPAIADW
jgi:hypothetical protein